MRRAAGTAVVAAFSLVAAPVFAQTAAPAAAASSGETGWRAATIARTARSLVRIKTVKEAAAPPAPVAAPSDRERRRTGRTDRTLEDFFAKMAPRTREGGGTGFVVDGARGLVATSAHVLDEARTITVVLPDGSERPAERIGGEGATGVAVLRIGGTALPALDLSTRAARTGDPALIVGHMTPLKAVLASQGMVMGETTDSDVEGRTDPPRVRYAMLDATIPDGSFGGSPVIGADGGVIGIVYALFGSGYGAKGLTVMIPAAGFSATVATARAGAEEATSRR